MALKQKYIVDSDEISITSCIANQCNRQIPSKRCHFHFRGVVEGVGPRPHQYNCVHPRGSQVYRRSCSSTAGWYSPHPRDSQPSPPHTHSAPDMSPQSPQSRPDRHTQTHQGCSYTGRARHDSCGYFCRRIRSNLNTTIMDTIKNAFTCQLLTLMQLGNFSKMLLSFSPGIPYKCNIYV